MIDNIVLWIWNFLIFALAGYLAFDNSAGLVVWRTNDERLAIWLLAGLLVYGWCSHVTWCLTKRRQQKRAP